MCVHTVLIEYFCSHRAIVLSELIMRIDHCVHSVHSVHGIRGVNCVLVRKAFIELTALFCIYCALCAQCGHICDHNCGYHGDQ